MTMNDEPPGPCAQGEANWYAVQCKPGQEQRAHENLINQGFTCFFPQVQIERIRSGARKQKLESLFPGYLFIELKVGGEDWSVIRSTRGVLRLVRFGSQPTPIPRAAMGAIMARTGAAEGAEQIFKAGDAVRITRGPFADLDAVFDRFNGEERAIVLISMLEKQHKLALAVGDISRGD